MTPSTPPPSGNRLGGASPRKSATASSLQNTAAAKANAPASRSKTAPSTPAATARAPRQVSRKRIAVIAGSVAVVLVGGWWLLRSVGLIGAPSTPDTKVIARVRTQDGDPSSSGGGGALIVPESRPVGRPAVQLALGEVPAWFRTAVDQQQFDPALLAARAKNETSGAAPLHRFPPAAPAPALRFELPSPVAPADPLARVRPHLKNHPQLAAWFARYSADVAAERPINAERLNELRELLTRQPIPAALIEAGTATITALEAPDTDSAVVWRKHARADQELPKPNSATARPATAPWRIFPELQRSTSTERNP